MVIMSKIFAKEQISDIELKKATAEELVGILTELPLIIKDSGYGADILEKAKAIAVSKIDRRGFTTLAKVNEAIDKENISNEAKDGIKRAMKIVSIFQAHEKLYYRTLNK